MALAYLILYFCFLRHSLFLFLFHFLLFVTLLQFSLNILLFLHIVLLHPLVNDLFHILFLHFFFLLNPLLLFAYLPLPFELLLRSCPVLLGLPYNPTLPRR